jgi:peptidoglycan hydrolase-like protein with peptidoglycan-binding domain
MNAITTKAMAKVAVVATSLAMATSMLSLAPVAHAECSVGSVDLHVGSSGAAVTCLQQGLIAKGYAIPAGATGYFGMQTQAAVKAWQVAAGISPAAGYFGPISRGKWVNMGGTASGGTSSGCLPGYMFNPVTGAACGTSTGGGSTSGLSGGEASLDTADMHTGDGSGSEAEEGVELASVDFDVEDGDVSVQRVEVTFEPQTLSTLEEKPWKYFDSVSVYADGKKLDEIDASDRDEWDEDGDLYTLTFSGLNYVVREDDNAELSFMADIADGIDESDLDQEFEITIPDDGIRAIDGAGIQNYTDAGSDAVTFGFEAEDSGEISVRESTSNPAAENLKVEDDQESDEYTVFVFEIRNRSDVDTLLTDLTVQTVNTGATSTDDIIQSATLVIDGEEFDADIEDANDGDLVFEDMDVMLDADSTTKATLKVTFRQLSGTTYASGDTIVFSVTASTDIEAEGDESGDTVTDLSGSADSETFTLSLTGFAVEAVSTSKSLTAATDSTDAYGTFTLKFDVTADEDDPLFIGKTAASSTATAGAVYEILKDNVVVTGGIETKSAILTSTASTENGTYRVDAGETETFTLTVTVDPAVDGNYAVQLTQVHYSLSDTLSPLLTFTVDSDDADFETDPLFVDEP